VHLVSPDIISVNMLYVGKNDTHVLVSYEESSREIVDQIKDGLKTAGFKIWIDVDNACTLLIIYY